jgi:hypothetical protein
MSLYQKKKNQVMSTSLSNILPQYRTILLLENVGLILFVVVCHMIIFFTPPGLG